MRTIKLIVQYDGSSYFGFQRQPDQVSVQEVIEKVLKKIYCQSMHIKYAGRTDSGVHAKGQVISYMDNGKIPFMKFPDIINRYLPEKIRVIDASIENIQFNPRKQAVSRTYSYWLYSVERNPLFDNYMFHVPYIKLELLNELCKYLIGEKDFGMLCSGRRSYKSTYREVFEAFFDTEQVSITGLKCQATVFRIKANSFLYHMVRKTVGLLIAVNNEQLTKSEFIKIINDEKNYKWAMVPGKALFLDEVEY